MVEVTYGLNRTTGNFASFPDVSIGDLPATDDSDFHTCS
jgi:hypothetical protein